MYRQGDVLLREVKELPEGAVPAGTNVLRYGEVTGHKHRIVGPALVYKERGEGGAETLFVQVLEGGQAQLVHEKHGRQEPAPGTYQVVFERELSPTGERTVMD